MADVTEDEYYLRFCCLTLTGHDEEANLKVNLWFNRVVEPGCYSHCEDYMTGTDIWKTCLTRYEGEMLERYLWDNGITNFTLDTWVDGNVKTLISMIPETHG